jgi:predicted acyltransferase
MGADAPAGRIRAVDAFRGYAILCVIFFNELAGTTGLPGWMYHGVEGTERLTYVDIGFPAFLYLVGLSIPLAVAARRRRGAGLAAVLRHAALRTLALVTMGIWMVWRRDVDPARVGLRGEVWGLGMFLGFWLLWYDLPPWRLGRLSLGPLMRAAGAGLLGWLALRYHAGMQPPLWLPTWWGVLGLIGWCYVLALLLYLAFPDRIGFVWAGLVAAAPWAYRWLEARAAGVGEPLHLVEPFFYLLIVAAGVWTSHRLFVPPTASASDGRRLRWLLGLLGASLLIGGGYGAIWVLSVADVTPDFLLFSVASSVAHLAVFFTLIEILRWDRWIGILMPAATMPLTAYLISEAFSDVMKVLGLTFYRDWGTAGLPGLLRAAAVTGVVMLIVYGLSQRRVRVRF